MITKKDKEKIIKDLVEKFNSCYGYFLINLLNFKTPDLKKIRDVLKENNAILKVVKKTLIYKANPNFPFKDEELKLPFAIVYNFDKNLSGFRSLKNLFKEGLQIQIIKGFLDEKILSKEEVLEIINLPSKEELIMKSIQSIKSPIFKLHNTLNFPLKKLIFILSQIKK